MRPNRAHCTSHENCTRDNADCSDHPRPSGRNRLGRCSRPFEPDAARRPRVLSGRQRHPRTTVSPSGKHAQLGLYGSCRFRSNGNVHGLIAARLLIPVRKAHVPVRADRNIIFRAERPKTLLNRLSNSLNRLTFSVIGEASGFFGQRPFELLR